MRIKEKHGMCYTRIYQIWQHMKCRCANKNDKRYYSYGGRGIQVCKEWIDSFLNFWEWAKTNGYNDDLTIERINVDGDYEPTNCTFIPMNQQSKNRSWRHDITINGITMSITEWSAKSGLGFGCIYSRIKKGITGEELIAPSKKPIYSIIAKQAGLSDRTIKNRMNKGISGEELLSPINRKKRFININGEINTLSGWSKKIGITTGALAHRIKLGLTGDALLAPKGVYIAGSGINNIKNSNLYLASPVLLEANEKGVYTEVV